MRTFLSAFKCHRQVDRLWERDQADIKTTQIWGQAIQHDSDILGTMPAGMVYLSSHFPVPGVKHEVTLKMRARLTATDGTIPNAKHSASGNSLRDIEDERHSKRTDEVITNGYSMVLFRLLTVASNGLLQIFICWGPPRDPASQGNPASHLWIAVTMRNKGQGRKVSEPTYGYTTVGVHDRPSWPAPTSTLPPQHVSPLESP